ncbi:MAG: hypothetical protein ACM3O6_13080 [Acidobacteriota bacterium]
MIEMTHSASGSLLGPEFDDFLYAPIGEEKNGMLLSVLSALARLDLDPWQEATELAGLPRENATQRLASLIATLPGVPSAHFDPGTIAAGLIARLPHRPDSNIPRRDTLPAVGTAGKTRAFIFAIFMVFLLGVQFVLASRQSPAQIDDANTQASGMVSPQLPPPNSDR